MEKEIKTVQDYLMAILPYQQKALAKSIKKHPHLLYRGQTDKSGEDSKRQLIATIRRDWRKGLNEKEQKVIEHVRRCLRDPIKGKNKDWQIEALARHHGVPTRFLDWSSNCLTALWFSVSKCTGEQNVSTESDDSLMSVVWILETREDDFKIGKDENTPIPNGKGRKTTIFAPQNIGRRAELQDSFMMRQVYEATKERTQGVVSEKVDGDAVIVSVERNSLFRGRCWRVPIANNVAVRRALRDELSLCGYDDKSLFPNDCELRGDISWRQLRDQCKEILGMNN